MQSFFKERQACFKIFFLKGVYSLLKIYRKLFFQFPVDAGFALDGRFLRITLRLGRGELWPRANLFFKKSRFFALRARWEGKRQASENERIKIKNFHFFIMPY